MFKRIGLFLMTNLAIVVVISTILSLFNVQPYLNQQGLNIQALLIFSAIIGFTGSFVSLLLSKWMAKQAYSVQIITKPTNEMEHWLVQTTAQLAQQARIGCPEIGIYQSDEPNAFATGWRKDQALVAVSSGLLRRLNKQELEGVLGHELAHIANGDMITLALMQGVVNTFVVFFARIAAYFVTQFLSKNDNDQRAIGGFAYYATAFIFEILFGILASIIVMAFSRWREYRADYGSSRLTSKATMIASLQALQRLTNVPDDERGAAFASFKIRHKPNAMLQLFSSHPPLEARINALHQSR